MENFILGIALSLHLGLDGSYNGFHPNVRFQNEELIVGVYLNSEKKISMYIGAEKNLNQYFDLEYGIVTGYDSFEIPVVPFARILYNIDEHNKIFVAPVAETMYNRTNYGINIEYEFTIGR